MGIEPGDTLTLRLEDGELRIISLRAAVKRAQEIVSKYVPGHESLSDQLIAERRAEAAREDRGE